MKITRIGWVAKKGKAKIVLENDEFKLDGVFDLGHQCSWFPVDWPPRKVLITVEDVEEKP